MATTKIIDSMTGEEFPAADTPGGLKNLTKCFHPWPAGPINGYPSFTDSSRKNRTVYIGKAPLHAG